MGNGSNLKRYLEKNNMNVKELSKKSGIKASTLYAIISRDAPIRYDFALKCAKVLDISVNEICNDVPTNFLDGETNMSKVNDRVKVSMDLSSPAFEKLKSLQTEINVSTGAIVSAIINQAAYEDIIKYVKLQQVEELRKTIKELDDLEKSISKDIAD